MKRTLSFLLTLALLIGTFSVSALAEGTTYHEAPMLAELVANGELPPVEERLPLEPNITPASEIGIYGGTYRGTAFGPTHGQVDSTGLKNVGVLRCLPDCTTTEPFVVKDYEANEDFTEYTFYLREGMKWSDGEPFTADDWLFWFYDITLDPVVSPVTTTRYVGASMEKIDDYTVKLIFPQSLPSFIPLLSKANSFWACKHYLSKWHINYNPDAQKLAEEEGYATWNECFDAHRDKGDAATDVNAPDITAWVLSEIDVVGNKFYKRNPYYFVVDREGNQLPYIDENHAIIVADANARALKLIAQELDAAGENPLPVSDYTLYKENEEAGDYKVYLFQNSRGADSSFTFTQTLEDPTLHSLYTNVVFREAMSLALDRDMINETLYFGLANIRQAVPPSNVSYFEPWMETYMIEYDPEGAAERLDSLGCDQWNADHTVRLMPDGREFNIILESTEEFAAVGEMAAEMWSAIGVKTTFKQLERSYARERFSENERDAQVFTLDTVAENSMYANYFGRLRPPFGQDDELAQAPLWVEWFNSNGERGERPPEELIDAREKIDRLVTLPMGSDEYMELGRDVLTTLTKGLYYIGTSVAPRIIILSNKLGNVPTEGFFANDYGFWYPYLCDSWYFTVEH